MYDPRSYLYQNGPFVSGSAAPVVPLLQVGFDSTILYLMHICRHHRWDIGMAIMECFQVFYPLTTLLWPFLPILFPLILLAAGFWAEKFSALVSRAMILYFLLS